MGIGRHCNKVSAIFCLNEQRIMPQNGFSECLDFEQAVQLE